MRKRSVMLAVFPLFVVACGDDTAGTPDVIDAAGETAVDTSAETSAAETSDIAGAGCPFAGTWNLQNVLCGSNDVTADWFRVIDRTTAVLAAGAGGCTLQSLNETDACKEEERGTLVRQEGDTWTVASQGITTCTPAACTFGGQDAPCAAGDRAGSYEATLVLADGRLTLTSPVGICASVGTGGMTTMVFEPR